MLLGKSFNTLDSKGRLFIPTKWRVDLTDHVVLLYGFGNTPDEKYLQLMSYDKFLELTEAVDSLHPTDLTFIKAKRFIFPNAEELNPDKQGRILIPQELARYADLSQETCLLGLSDHVEIWNPALYDKIRSEYNFDQFAGDMQSLADRSSADKTGAR
ncbi:MAG: cell division/cell wall cluster transcriptional repressor MraZ [Clostridia bacterium]|nr:cell division/cell wall cluster transcriptional repressor MraZ [Clostridia bacterium]MBR6006076.1 cell division/cell wall cluster transcriptional repressor MraZ [Clostridia bacterium]